MNERPHPLLSALEHIERLAWEDLAAVAPAPVAQGIGLKAKRLNHALLFMASRVPQFQFNWLAGAGLAGDDGSAIDLALEEFRAADQDKYFIQIAPGPRAGDCAARAAAAGLAPHPLAWAKFHHETTAVPAVDTALDIREVGPEERAAFADTAVAGFGMPPMLASWLGQIVGRPHWHAYVAFAGAEAAATGALYVDGDFAWLGIGATRPASRRQGAQSALLAHRLREAARFGARHATTETGVPQAAAPAPSYQNIRRAGFDVAYVRPNWTQPQWL